MDFLKLIRTLESGFSQILPGEAAQQQMAPDHRLPASYYLENAINYKVAGVMILFFPDPIDAKARVVLIERTGGGDVHGGQISFPGGKVEEGDADLLSTALRETEEEIGIIREQIKFIGALSSLYIPPSNFLVHPFVGYFHEQPEFHPNTSEVQQVLTPSFTLFTDVGSKQESLFSGSRGHEVKAPFYQVGDLKVWGATAMMMSELTTLIAE